MDLGKQSMDRACLEGPEKEGSEWGVDKRNRAGETINDQGNQRQRNACSSLLRGKEK
jgi:hypothetical protein